MKTLFMIASIVAIGMLSTSNAIASWGHDSVSFDGDESLFPAPQDKPHCTVRVLALEGTAKGLVMVHAKENICGEIRYENRWAVKKLTVGDDVSINEPISTLPGTTLTLQTHAGSIIEVDGDSEITLADVCGDNPKPHLGINYGGARINDRPAPPPQNDDDPPGEPPPPPGPEETPPPPTDPQPIITQTKLVKVTPKGTEYSVRTSGSDGAGETVVRVYSGSVEVVPMVNGAAQDMAAQGSTIEALTKQLQEGKITQKQYTERIMAISMASAKKMDGVVRSLVLKAGEKCAVSARGELSKAKKFDVKKEK
jgi:hypothetical protein